MTCKLCNDTGEQRYWEGRWRDEKAENERLRAALKDAKEDIDVIGDDGSGHPTNSALRAMAKIDAVLGNQQAVDEPEHPKTCTCETCRAWGA